MVDLRTVALADVFVDQKNYRLPPQPTQRDALRAMVSDQGQKLTVLARDILTHGLSPGELLLASEHPSNPGKFIVHEGNRRITSLKVMESPELAAGLITERAFKRLGDAFAANPIREVLISVLPDRENAMFWIQRRHTTGHKGAGTEVWDPYAQDRHDRDHGRPARTSIMALEFSHEDSDEWREVEARLSTRTTTVDRVLDMPYLAEALGILIDPKAVTITFENRDEDAGVALLRRILMAMGAPDFRFGLVEDEGDRRRFIDTFSEWAVTRDEEADSTDEDEGEQDETRTGKTDGDTGESESRDEKEGGKGNDARDRRAKKDPLARDTLASSRSSLVLHVEGVRLAKLYLECRAIKVGKHPNAAAILMRVFLELSTDEFLEREVPLPVGMAAAGKKWSDAHLEKKIGAAVEAIDPTGKDKSLDAARRTGPDFLHGVSVLHSYVHSRTFVPAPDELKRTWDRWHPYLKRLHDALNPP